MGSNERRSCPDCLPVLLSDDFRAGPGKEVSLGGVYMSYLSWLIRNRRCGSMPPTAVTYRGPSQLVAQIAEDHTGPRSRTRPCHWDG